MIDSTYFRVVGKSMFLRKVLTGTTPTPCPLHRSTRLAPALYSANAKGSGSDSCFQCPTEGWRYYVRASRLVLGSKRWATWKLAILFSSAHSFAVLLVTSMRPRSA